MAKPTTTRAKGARKPPTRAKRGARKAPARPRLEQHHLDLIGLALVALAVFTGFLLFGGWDGGRVGQGIVDGADWLLGELRLLVPVALAAVGAILVLRPVLPAVRPFRSGGVCLALSCALGLAAGTVGAPGRGGHFGDALLSATRPAIGLVGTHIVAVFLFLAAVLLLTGASVAGVLKATHAHVSDTTRSLRRTASPPGAVAMGRRRPDMTPPEDDDEPIRVQRRVEDLNERFADAFAPDADPDATPEPDLGTAELEMPAEEGSEPEPELDPLVPAADAEATEDDEDATVVYSADQLTPQGRLRPEVTNASDFVWRVPPASLLRRSTAEQTRPDTAGQERTALALVESLGHFGVQAQLVGTIAGPHITRYELRLAPGIKMSKVAQLKDDLAYALAATDIRILAPVPGKTAVGVEVPNERRKVVQLGDVLGDAPEDASPLTIWLGKDVAGRPIFADLAKMPHLLVAGTTGAGKSACVNAMLSSILLRATPHDVRLVLVDPKQVELNHYESIPHLLTPVITSPRRAANALQNLVKEMEDRYGTMSLARTRSLPELNRVRERRGEAPLPFILCVIDELADLMMVAPADVEDSIIRLAQKARAVGIHLVLATQSPRVDVITGMIKANVPSRIAFAVSSQTDSRVILDSNGAESLLGKGDMLYSPVGSSRLQRIQGAYIDEAQIEAITTAWAKQGEPELREDLLEEVEADGPADETAPEEFSPDEDPLLEDAIRLVAEMGTASTSMLQRRLRLGYTRAGRLIDMLERRGVISGYEGSKPRQVLVAPADAERFIAGLRRAPEGPGEPVAVADDGPPDPE